MGGKTLMKKYKAILFDLDGTLLDSKKSVIKAVHYISNKYAPNRFTYKDIEERFGESLDNFIGLIEKNNRDVIYRDYMNYITRNHDKAVKLFPSTKSNLELLNNRGYQLAVITNKQRELTYRGLKLFKIDHLFDCIVTLDDVNRGKPDPQMINLACHQLSMHKNEVIMVGDSLFDIKAAEQAEIECVAIDWYGDFNNEIYDTIKSHHIFKSLDLFLKEFLKISKEEVFEIG